MEMFIILFDVGIHMSKLIKLYTLNMCIILYVRYTSLEL